MKTTMAIACLSAIPACLVLSAQEPSHPVACGGLSERPRQTVPDDSAATPLARLVATQDYFPGTRDRNGQWSGGTETMELRAHDGKVFYFGGHDCAYRNSHNTAWIYRATLPLAGEARP